MPSPPPRLTKSMLKPWPRRVATNSFRRAKAFRNGASSVIWLPICMCTPDTSMGGNLDRERAPELAFRYHVHAGAEPSQGGKHAETGVGLDRIADECAGHAGERVGEYAVVALERRRRIAIEGGSHGGGEIGKIDLLGVEHVFVGHAAPVGEMMHRRRRGLFEKFIDPEAPGRGLRHFG